LSYRPGQEDYCKRSETLASTLALEVGMNREDCLTGLTLYINQLRDERLTVARAFDEIPPTQ